MSFAFTRFINVSDVGVEEPGGVFTLGGTNSSLFTGDIDFVDIPPVDAAAGVWSLPITSM